MKKNRHLIAASLGALSVAAGAISAMPAYSAAASAHRATTRAAPVNRASAHAAPVNRASTHTAPAHRAAKRRVSTTLKVAKVSVGGTRMSILVDGSGHAVYLLTGDSAKHALCTSRSCLTYWPAVTSTTAKPHISRGVKGRVGVWRHHGIDQVTIDGHPLYTFAGDGVAGRANGQGQKSFGGVWEVLTRAGVGVSGRAKAPAHGSGSGSGGSGGGYGAGY